MHYAIAGGNINGVSMILNNEKRGKDSRIQEDNELRRMINDPSVAVAPLHLAVSNLKLSLTYLPQSMY